MLIETEEYMDVSEAVQVLGIKRARVSQLCKEKRFPGQVKVGHFWLIPREAVENYTRLKPGKKKGGVKNDN